jgi:hypothetical protein
VYSASGGVPELVSADAGVGVPTALDWDHDEPPSAEAFAAAVLRAADDLDARSAAARAHAAGFDVQRWLERHATLFARFARV